MVNEVEVEDPNAEPDKEHVFPDQASTAAPPDDERNVFDEKRLFAWMMRSWTSSGSNMLHWTASNLRGTTYVQPPTRFKFALQQAQHAILRAIIHNNPTSPASESAWKALVLCSWLLLGRPAVNASGTFWMRDWSSFGPKIGQHSHVPNVMLLRCRTRHAERTSSRCSHVFAKLLHLARTGEKGRALSAARNAPPVPVAEQIVQEIKSLYPADPEPPAPVPAPVSAPFLSEVAEHVPTTLRRLPRLSEPGPLGMRAEHWYDFGPLVGNSDLFVQVIAHIAAAAVPNPLLQYLKDHTACQSCLFSADLRSKQ